MKRLQKFGYIVMGSALTLAVMGTALAVTTALTITVDPTIKIQVNGAEFHPKDEKGNDVMTFSYGGTTYAPVRAMAAAFGLEVGYDKVTRMATVGETAAPETTPAPDTALSADYSKWTAEEEKAYQEFKGMWRIDKGVSEIAASSDFVIWRADYIGDLRNEVNGSGGLHSALIEIGKKTITQYVLRMAKEIKEQHPNEKLYFELYGRDNWPIVKTGVLVDGKASVGGFTGFGKEK